MIFGDQGDSDLQLERMNVYFNEASGGELSSLILRNRALTVIVSEMMGASVDQSQMNHMSLRSKLSDPVLRVGSNTRAAFWWMLAACDLHQRVPRDVEPQC